MILIWHLVFDVFILTVFWWSAWTDIRTQTIFEPLVILAIGIAIGTHFSMWRIVMTILVFTTAYLVVRIGKLGLGDAELLALLTSSFGVAATLVSITIGAAAALAFALVEMAIQKKRRALLPLAPFLAVGISASFFIATLDPFLIYELMQVGPARLLSGFVGG